MIKKTPLHQQHQLANAQLVDFAGWDMPLHYGSQIQEHKHLREHCGMFDVSHMGVLEVEGEDAMTFLRLMLANDVAKLKSPGRALYTCMLNEQGGVIDDLIVYYLDDNYYRIVLNASRREVDIDWLQQHTKDFAVTLSIKPELCIIAVQGPEAIDVMVEVLGEKWTGIRDLKPFHCIIDDNIQIARTGYTGEDGVEIILAANSAIELWQRLLNAGVKPCGLGARDTLRLEAGLNLYGIDMDEQTSPLVSNLAWTVSFKDENRNFIGRKALELEKEKGIEQSLVGLVMQAKGVLRNHQEIFSADKKIGEITSGSFSPTLGQAIALARLAKSDNPDVYIDRRGKKVSLRIVRPPFVRFGKKVFED